MFYILNSVTKHRTDIELSNRGERKRVTKANEKQFNKKTKNTIDKYTSIHFTVHMMIIKNYL